MPVRYTRFAPEGVVSEVSRSHTTPVQSLAEHVEVIASSARFRKAPVLRELLLFLLKHRDEEISEYAIAVDALGRKPDFDPKLDATVRVQIARLRQRLKDYYENEGRSDVVRVFVPPGSYRLDLEQDTAPPVSPVVAAPAAPAAAVESARRPRWLVALVAGVGVLAAVLAWDDWRLRNEVAGRGSSDAPPALSEFWKPLTSGKSPVTVVVPAPLFFSWRSKSLMVRDFHINEPGHLEQSPALRGIRQMMGEEPVVSQLDTVSSDTLAGAAVTNYLHARNVSVSTLDTPTLTLDALTGRNAVILVGPGSVPQLDPLLAGTNYYLLPGDGCVHNRKPVDGEPEKWKDITLAPERTISYGIVSRLPGRTPGTHMLVLAGRYNTGLSMLLTTPSELAEVEKLHRGKGAPEYFEMVVRFERNGDRILRTKPIALRNFAK